MRKYVMTMAALFTFVGFSFAVEYTFVKWNASTSELTVNDGGKDATFKVTDKTAVKITDKEGKVTDGDINRVKKSWEKNGEKMAEKKAKLDLTVKGDEVTEVKVKGGRPKDKKDKKDKN